MLSHVSTPNFGSHVSTPGLQSHVSTPGFGSHVSTPGLESHVSTPGLESHVSSFGQSTHSINIESPKSQENFQTNSIQNDTLNPSLPQQSHSEQSQIIGDSNDLSIPHFDTDEDIKSIDHVSPTSNFDETLAKAQNLGSEQTLDEDVDEFEVDDNLNAGEGSQKNFNFGEKYQAIDSGNQTDLSAENADLTSPQNEETIIADRNGIPLNEDQEESLISEMEILKKESPNAFKQSPELAQTLENLKHSSQEQDQSGNIKVDAKIRFKHTNENSQHNINLFHYLPPKIMVINPYQGMTPQQMTPGPIINIHNSTQSHGGNDSSYAVGPDGKLHESQDTPQENKGQIVLDSPPNHPTQNWGQIVYSPLIGRPIQTVTNQIQQMQTPDNLEPIINSNIEHETTLEHHEEVFNNLPASNVNIIPDQKIEINDMNTHQIDQNLDELEVYNPETLKNEDEVTVNIDPDFVNGSTGQQVLMGDELNKNDQFGNFII